MSYSRSAPFLTAAATLAGALMSAPAARAVDWTIQVRDAGGAPVPSYRD